MSVSAGRFSADWWLDGWPVSAGLACQRGWDGRFSLDDLKDLQHVLTRAISKLEVAEDMDRLRSAARITNRKGG